jgi:indolepyruvate ferredoxin oxidoreductase beta subunit
MKTDIILAGVGGQGILTIAAVIGFASLHEKRFIKQSEVHGMSQRGGAVESHLRIASNPIASDLIAMGTADLILSVEPMEVLRYLPFLSPEGWIITNSVPFVNISDYPPVEKIEAEVRRINNHRWIDAEKVARDCGSPKSSNIVMLGAAANQVGLDFQSLQKGIEMAFGHKGQEVVDGNLKALDAGKSFGK